MNDAEPRVARATLALLRTRLAAEPVPRVRALHLPPQRWAGSKDGEFGALELDTGALGLSYLLLADTWPSLAAAQAALRGADAFALAQAWADPGAGAGARALGFAAVNALSRICFERHGLTPPDAGDSIGGLDPQPGEWIGMVGYFPPLVAPVTARGARLTVLELRPDLAGERDGVTVTLDPAALAACTQVLCTSTVLLNHTLDRVLDACTAAQRFVLVGPGAACLPDALFARGVTALAGHWIEDANAFKQALVRGERWGHTARKTLWTRQTYEAARRDADRTRHR